MNVGKMRSRLTIQVPIRAKASNGQVTAAWATLRTIFCQFQPVSTPSEDNGQWRGRLTGSEKQFGGKTRSQITHRLTCRAQPEYLTTDMRVVEYTLKQNLPVYRVFNIYEALIVENIDREMRLEVIENLSDRDNSIALYQVTLDANGIGVLGNNGEYVTTEIPLTTQPESYTWGEIDFTATGSITLTIPSGSHFKPTRLSALVTLLTGTVVTQPTINLGTPSNHTKYLSGKTFTQLTTLLSAQDFTNMLASAGEVSLWLEIATAGSVSSGGTYGGALYASGDLISQ